jgi:nitroimidazol reductase NimA-like FMN-containing flavoprotein (pyridoxamine 5'-phosphate oxidase superfamily)
VGFELDTGHEPTFSDNACDCSTRFQSVIGTGVLSLVEDTAEKIRSLNLIMEQATGRPKWEYPEAMLTRTAVFRLTVREISCKFHP